MAISYTEDNVNVFEPNNVALRRGLVDGNNSPSGDGVMFECGGEARHHALHDIAPLFKIAPKSGFEIVFCDECRIPAPTGAGGGGTRLESKLKKLLLNPNFVCRRTRT